MYSMKDKIVLITGGSQGYGKAMAKRFVEGGATVIIAAKNLGKLEAAKQETGCAELFSMDVTSPADWERVKKFIEEKYGRLDVLINNAGGGVAIKEVTEQSIEEIDTAIKLNLNSVIYGSRAFAEMMKTQKSGTILNVSSVCAKEAWSAWSVYASAKSGVLNFSKGLYVELRPYNVRVTTLIPAAANTGFNGSAGIGEVPRLLKPEDIAELTYDICKMPNHVVVEEITIWGIDQEVNPL
ncbi:MAG TPA: SDR family oxidoreductase [Oscillospiraceae bacterium]|nr:SDR family oxidoreductase [Oscillospiraceae bacterium]HPK36167.1 SDR family oxidoreductase [Oscillospiraceae bacterium]HPR76545.1 SDR family oxidoreductase [Oscillospiraceae bacterium]